MITEEIPLYLQGNYEPNSVKYWESTDDKKKFTKFLNDEKSRHLLKINDYDENTIIEYRSNNYRFRGNDIKTNIDSLVVLGCSYTEGIGLNFEHTFGYICAEKLGLYYINLGKGATGPITSFLIAEYWIPIIKPKYVLYLEPSGSRIETITKDNDIIVLDTGLRGKKHSEAWCENFVKLWTANDENYRINAKRSELAIRYICEKNNSKFFQHTCVFDKDSDLDLDFEKRELINSRLFEINGEGEKFCDLARDLCHWGKHTQQYIANKFLNQIYK